MMRYRKSFLCIFFSLKTDLSTLSLYNMLYYYSLTRFAVCINSISFFVSFPFRYDDVIIFRRQTGIMSSVFLRIFLFLMGLYTFKLNIYCYSCYFLLFIIISLTLVELIMPSFICTYTQIIFILFSCFFQTFLSALECRLIDRCDEIEKVSFNKFSLHSIFYMFA